jgi:hypothetical protein
MFLNLVVLAANAQAARPILAVSVASVCSGLSGFLFPCAHPKAAEVDRDTAE